MEATSRIAVSRSHGRKGRPQPSAKKARRSGHVPQPSSSAVHEPDGGVERALPDDGHGEQRGHYWQEAGRPVEIPQAGDRAHRRGRPRPRRDRDGHHHAHVAAGGAEHLLVHAPREDALVVRQPDALGARRAERVVGEAQPRRDPDRQQQDRRHQDRRGAGEPQMGAPGRAASSAGAASMRVPPGTRTGGQPSTMTTWTRAPGARPVAVSGSARTISAAPSRSRCTKASAPRFSTWRSVPESAPARASGAGASYSGRSPSVGGPGRPGPSRSGSGTPSSVTAPAASRSPAGRLIAGEPTNAATSTLAGRA